MAAGAGAGAGSGSEGARGRGITHLLVMARVLLIDVHSYRTAHPRLCGADGSEFAEGLRIGRKIQPVLMGTLKYSDDSLEGGREGRRERTRQPDSQTTR